MSRRLDAPKVHPMLLLDLLFRRSARRSDRQDVPAPRPRAKTGRSPRARLHDEAWSLLP